MRSKRLSSLFVNLQESLGSGSVPTLSIAGNTFTVQWEGNEKSVAEFDKESGITYVRLFFLDASDKISKIYYEGKYDPKKEEKIPPVCFSDDGIKPAVSSSKKQCDTCASCKHNAWGTGVSEMGNKGKACRDFVKTAVLIPEFNTTMAFQLRIPPASLKRFLAYIAMFHESGRTIDMLPTIVYFKRGDIGQLNFGAGNFDNEEEKTLVENFEGNTSLLIGSTIGPERQLEAPKESPVKDEEPEKKSKPKKNEIVSHSFKKAKPTIEETEDTDEDEEEMPKGIPDMKGTRLSPVQKLKKEKANIPEGGIKNKLAGIMNMSIDD